MPDLGLYPVPDDLNLGATIRGFVPGQRLFDRYTLQRVVGRGGMGVVWLAQDEKLEQRVALKFLPEAVRLDSAALDDLKRETRRGLSLAHPHIVRIYDFVDDATAAAISMEYVDGPTLSALRIEQPKRVFDPAQIQEWMTQLVEALDYAHRRVKIVHRDLKPANLMINSAGELKVADFGIARSITDSISRVTMRGGSSGTLAYMSPQQAQGKPPKVSDEIYALGATLYELLTGKPPFYSGNIQHQLDSITPPTMAQRRADLEIEGGAIPDAWEQTVAACLAKEPEQRPQSIAEVAERLGLRTASVTHATSRPATSPTVETPPSEPPPPKPSRKGWLIGVGLAVAVLALGGLGYYYGFATPADKARQAEIAKQEADKKAAAAEAEKQKADAAALQAEAQAKSEQEKTALEKTKQEADAKAAAAEVEKQKADVAAAQSKTDAEKAQQAAPAAAPLPPEAQEPFNKGGVAAQQQDYMLATRYFQDARKIAPDAPDIYYNLGLAEAKIPGRELRAICWFGAYLAANPHVSNATAVKEQIDVLDVKGQSNLSRLIQTAQDAANQTGNQQENSLHDVAVLWAESGDLTAALKIAEGNYRSLIGIAEVQATAGDRAGAQQTLASARKTADLIQNADWKSQAYGAVAEAQATVGDIAGAQNTAELIQTPYLKCESQIAIANAQTKAADIAGARQTLGSALKTSDLVGSSLECEFKTKVAQAQVNAGDLEGARQTLASARKLADSESVHSSVEAELKCNALREIFYLQAQAGDLAGARQTLASALKTVELITDAREKKNAKGYITQDYLGTLMGIVTRRIEAGDIVGALNNADLIQDAGIKGYAQENIAEAQAKAGDIAGAQKTADSIPEDAKGGASFEHSKSGSQEAVAEAQVKAGDIAGAQKTADLIQDAQKKSEAQRNIADAQVKAGEAQVKAGDIAGALKTFDLIQDAGAKSQAQFDISEAQVKAGNIAGALKIADLIQKADDKSRAQLSIANAQVKAGDNAGALKTADLIQDAFWRSCAQANAGDIAGALKTADLIQKADDKSRAQLSIAGAQVNAGDNAGALKTADLIQDARQKSGAQATAGDIAGALKTADLIQKAEDKGNAQIAVVEAQAEKRDIAGALKTADLIQDAQQKKIALRNIPDAQAQAGDTAGAQKTVDLIEDADLKYLALRDIAAVQVKTGDKTGALQTLANALKAVDLIQDAQKKNMDQRDIADDQANAGDVPGALKTADLFLDTGWKSTVQEDIADVQAKAGDIAGALKTAGLMHKADIKSRALETVAETQIKAGDIAGAQKTADLIEDAHTKDGVQEAIAEAQTKAGDIAGAQKTADLIEDRDIKRPAQKAIDDAKKKAGGTNVAQAPAHPAASAPSQPPVAAGIVSDWLDKLDDTTTYDYCPLNTGPFLDLTSYLKSLPSGNPQDVFKGLYDTAKKIIAAQNRIDQMLKQQAKEQAGKR